MKLFEGLPRWQPNLDYTAEIEVDGKVFTYRNPKEKDGELTDKNHRSPEAATVRLLGTSFWNWKDRTQAIVGIDVDTGNHGLSEDRFNIVLEALRQVPWLELRYSKGGKGIHAFAAFSEQVSIVSRSEQAALGNAVCVAASRVCGVDIKDAKCCAGGNMWVYAKDRADNAFEIIKPATSTLNPSDLPPGWRHAVEAGKGKIDFAPPEVGLTGEHLAIEKQIADTGYSITWVDAHKCWHIHTRALQLAHNKHGYKGIFITNSPGDDKAKPNGYMFPLPDGGFLVQRFGKATEHESWIDGTYAYLNVVAPLTIALDHFSDAKIKRQFVFSSSRLTLCLAAAGVALDIPELFKDRTIYVEPLKDDILLTVVKYDADGQLEGWGSVKNNWQRSLTKPQPSRAEIEASTLRASAFVRAVGSEAESSKWVHRADDGSWRRTTAGEVENILKSLYLMPAPVMGELRRKPYTLVAEPFCSEYLPGRRWNIDSAQYACEPATEPTDTPTWDLIWNHLGASLDDGIEHDDDCKRTGIVSGAHYLQCWVALLLRIPLQRLPYLFLFSPPQGTGKSSLGVAIMDHLIKDGVGEVTAETFTDKFTSELEGKVLCLIEEVDLNRGGAYERIKNLVTNPLVPIRRMRTDTYRVRNISHFIHTAQDPDFVPVEADDMRIVIGQVQPLSEPVKAQEFHERLKAEAPSMLRKLLDMDLPEPSDRRLWLPVVQTAVKEQLIAGVYGDGGPTASEQTVIRFVDQCVKRVGAEPIHNVLSAYCNFLHADDQSSNVPPVPKNAFLKTLKECCHLDVTSRQHRIEGKQVWCYDGISLKA